MPKLIDPHEPTHRRAFLRDGALVLLAAGVDHASAAKLLADDSLAKPRVRIGLVTDLHYADKKPAGSRHYREAAAKLASAAKDLAKEKPEIIVELGDFVDAASTVAEEKKWLDAIQAQFAKLPGEKHYVLGNHCVDTLTKKEFLGAVGKKESYYSFDHGGFHFVVLDACFRSDGTPYGRKNFKWTDANIPPPELAWLKKDLAATKRKTIVFAHQRLDVSINHGVRNAAAVRKVLERTGNVLAVFQGHNHINDHKLIGGIHYCTLMAMIEGSGEKNNAYAAMDLFDDNVIQIRGFVKQQNYRWV